MWGCDLQYETALVIVSVLSKDFPNPFEISEVTTGIKVRIKNSSKHPGVSVNKVSFDKLLRKKAGFQGGNHLTFQLSSQERRGTGDESD